MAEARGVKDGYFLAVLLPQQQMTILDYNRVLRDLNGLTPDAVLREIGRRYTIEPSDKPVRPSRPDEVGMVVGGGWRRLTLKPEIMAEAARSGDPVARLPVTLLAKNVIEPIFGVDRSAPRQAHRLCRRRARARGAGAAGQVRRGGRRLRALSDADGRPHGGRRRRRDHAAEIDLVRAQARRRHCQPHAGLICRAGPGGVVVRAECAFAWPGAPDGAEWSSSMSGLPREILPDARSMSGLGSTSFAKLVRSMRPPTIIPRPKIQLSARRFLNFFPLECGENTSVRLALK